MGRCSAAVDTDVVHDRTERHHACGDRDLDGVALVEVAVGRPAVHAAGGEHCGVLARAVLLYRRRFDAGGPCSCPRRGTARSSRSVGEVGLVEAVPNEDRSDCVEVHRGTIVARARHGQLRVVEFETGSDHGVSLHWLEGRPRVDDQIGITDRGPGHAGDVDRHAGPMMDRLLEAVARGDRDRCQSPVEAGHAGSGVGAPASGGALGSPEDRDDRGSGTAVRWLSITS